MAEGRVGAGVRRIAVVGVDDVAGGAAAGAIIAGMIVRAGKREDWIEEPCFLQAEENGIGAQLGAESAIAEFVVGLTGIFFARGIACLGFFAAAALEDAQDVSRL